MWINYLSMFLCPLGPTLVAQIFQKLARFWSSPIFYPNLPIFLHGCIRHIRDIFQLCTFGWPSRSCCLFMCSFKSIFHRSRRTCFERPTSATVLMESYCLLWDICMRCTLSKSPLTVPVDFDVGIKLVWEPPHQCKCTREATKDVIARGNSLSLEKGLLLLLYFSVYV